MRDDFWETVGTYSSNCTYDSHSYGYSYLDNEFNLIRGKLHMLEDGDSSSSGSGDCYSHALIDAVRIMLYDIIREIFPTLLITTNVNVFPGVKMENYSIGPIHIKEVIPLSKDRSHYAHITVNIYKNREIVYNKEIANLDSLSEEDSKEILKEIEFNIYNRILDFFNFINELPVIVKSTAFSSED